MTTINIRGYDMNKYYLYILPIIFSFMATACVSTAVIQQDSLPPKNPYLADSDYPILHANTGAAPVTSMAGPVDQSRRLKPDEITWKPVGFGNGWEFNYSGPYADGRQAIWIGGSDRLIKLDADSLETLASYDMTENPHTGEEVRKVVSQADAMTAEAKKDPVKLQELLDYLADIIVPILRTTGAGALYRFLSNENEQYVMTLNPDTKDILVGVYGDKVSGDIESDIVLKRQWTMPREEGVYSVGMAMSITYDGWVVLATTDGRLFAVSRDLKQQQMVQLPGNEQKGKGGYMGAFVRNGIAIDDVGGIYVVTRNHFHRVQWTGKKLSLDPADGAWSVEYKNGVNGSGTTPTLMGWGNDNDKLVVIADGKEDVAVNLYWRDNIPDDWQGLPGHPRRLAGTIPLGFGEVGPKKFKVEGSPLVHNYGVFFPNDTSKTPPPPQGAPDRDIFAKYHSIIGENYTIQGGVRYDWDPKKRHLGETWITPLELCPTICSHASNDLLYCLGRRNNEFVMEAIDWDSGKSRYHYILGESYKFNSHGAVARIAPNGAIDSPSLASGLIRISPDIIH